MSKIDDLARLLTNANNDLAHRRRIRDGLYQDLARLEQEIKRTEEVREETLKRLAACGANNEGE